MFVQEMSPLTTRVILSRLLRHYAIIHLYPTIEESEGGFVDLQIGIEQSHVNFADRLYTYLCKRVHSRGLKHDYSCNDRRDPLRRSLEEPNPEKMIEDKVIYENMKYTFKTVRSSPIKPFDFRRELFCRVFDMKTANRSVHYMYQSLTHTATVLDDLYRLLANGTVGAIGTWVNLAQIVNHIQCPPGSGMRVKDIISRAMEVRMDPIDPVIVHLGTFPEKKFLVRYNPEFRYNRNLSVWSFMFTGNQ